MLKKFFQNYSRPVFALNSKGSMSWCNNQASKVIFNEPENVNIVSDKIDNTNQNITISFCVFDEEIYLNANKIGYDEEKNLVYEVSKSDSDQAHALALGFNCARLGKVDFFLQRQALLSNKETTGFEALARLYDSDGNLIGNEEFMPLIDARFQLDILLPQAIKTISQSIKKGIQDTIWINVSADVLEKQEFVDKIIKKAQTHNVPTQNIGVELTESIKVQSMKIANNNVQKLAKNGIQFAIDDFGTGYAAIRRLAFMPVNLLKLDKTFIENIEQTKTKTVISGIVSLAEELGSSVLAEGIETNDKLLSASNLGIEYGQGWHLGKPRSLDDIISDNNN